MKKHVATALVIAALGCSGLPSKNHEVAAQSVSAPAMTTEQLVQEFGRIEVSSVADAIEQLLGQSNHMLHSMRPVATTKFVGPAVTVMLRKEEHKEGGAASQGMLDAIDSALAGSVYVMVLEDGENVAGIGGLMATAMKARGLAGAVIDGGVRDVGQIQKIQFPVYSRSIVPSTSINHYRFAGSNIPVRAAGVPVFPNDLIMADQDGVVVIPRDKADQILAKAQQLDQTEHTMYPFIEKYRSIKEAVERFGRI